MHNGARYSGLWLALALAASAQGLQAEPAASAASVAAAAGMQGEDRVVAQWLSSGLAYDAVILSLQHQRGLALPAATVTAATARVPQGQQLALAEAGIGLAPTLEVAQAVADALIATAGEPSALATAAQAALLQRRKVLAGPPHYRHDPLNAIGTRDGRIAAWEVNRSPEVSPSR